MMQPLSGVHLRHSGVKSPLKPNPAQAPASPSVRFGADAKLQIFPELGGALGTEYEGIEILGGARTPFGKHFGALKHLTAEDLAFWAGKGALEKTGIPVEDVTTFHWGNIIGDGQTSYLPRNVMRRLGAPDGRVGELVNQLCGSGLASIQMMADRAVQASHGNPDFDFIAMAGGAESMSGASVSMPKILAHLAEVAGKVGKSGSVATTGFLNGVDKATGKVEVALLHEIDKAGNTLKDYLTYFVRANMLKQDVETPERDAAFQIDDVQSGLTHRAIRKVMIDTAEQLRKLFNIKPEELDEFAYLSQQRAAKAITEGKLKDEITPILDQDGKPLLTEDEGVFGTKTDKDKLAELRHRQGTTSKIHLIPEDAMHTAAHASRIVDGAASLLVTNSETAARLKKRLGLQSLGKLIATGRAGVAPEIMGYGAAQAAKAALKASKLDLKTLVQEGQILIEVNEAFAAVALVTIKELSQTYDIPEHELLKVTNVNGGAIALGHPLAVSGARLSLTGMLEGNRRPNVRYVLATLCEGGGAGIAGIYELSQH